MATAAGRVHCARCGANNFETQAACWKCGNALSAAPSPAPRSAAPSSVAPASAAPFPPGSGQPALARPVSYPVPETRPDPIVAIVAGVCLAIFFPYVAVPVGIVFMMLDDRRKIEVGRVTLIAGIISTIIQLLFTFWFMKAAFDQGMGAAQTLMRARAAASGEGGEGGESLPGLSLPGGLRPGRNSAPVSVPSLPPQENVPFPDAPNIPGTSGK